MANWSNPTNSSLYSDVLTNLKDRDVDAGTLFLSAPTNPVTGMIRFNRTTDLFEEYNGSTWVAQPISVAGGGTGAATAADARSNLGLGTLSTQNSNAINVTGGSISGLTSLGVSGNFTASGTITGTVPNASTTATSNNTASAIVARDASGNFSAGTITAALTGNVTGNVSGNAGTVTNGVYTSGSYSDPSWITALAATKLSGTIADARLSSNVPLLNAEQTFSAAQHGTGQPKGRAYIESDVTIANDTLTTLNSGNTIWRLTFIGGGLTISEAGYFTGFIALKTGYYYLSAQITFNNSGSGVRRLAVVRSSDSYVVCRSEAIADTTNYVVLNCSGLIYATLGDQFYVKVYQNSGGNLAVKAFDSQSNHLCGIMLW